ncbi:aspartic peptidase domain-containing protein [Kockovaella imperatae]|uniref:Aspartic peptidase domain-containing protein n=1 Tax=Kockovaella imperatae TaxID=4999 RepID=A0A1Y1UCW6_9TREE|nr:aspartic peptidase domain-containing protein [Kockovaella imperatae]ORX35387.1 aspartic peptidase domain-containing protein [Kockovaella imperatae]
MSPLWILLFMASLGYAAKVMPMTPHRLDHSPVLRREYAKRGKLHLLDKSSKTSRSASRPRIVERFLPEYVNGPGANLRRGASPSNLAYESSPQARSGSPSSVRRLTKRQGAYLPESQSSSPSPQGLNSFMTADGSSSRFSPANSATSQMVFANLVEGSASSSGAASITSSGSASVVGSVSTSNFASAASIHGSGSASVPASSTGSGTGPRPSGQYFESLPIDAAYGIAYTIEVEIGPNRAVAPLTVDTGSTDLWVCSTSCSTCHDAGMSQVIDTPDDAQDGGSIAYGSGKLLASKLITTSVYIDDITLDQFSVQAATSIDPGMQITAVISNSSGIWGMGLTPGDQRDTLIDALYSQGAITSPLIGIYLARYGADDSSQVVIGDPFNLEDNKFGIDFDHKANLTQAIAADVHYNVMMDDFKLFDVSLQGMQNLVVVPDTGSTPLFVPNKFYDGIMATLGNGTTWTVDTGGTTEYVFPCDLYAPDALIANLVFGGRDFHVQWQDIVDGPYPSLYGNCVPRIVPVPESIPDMFILGDAFLVNVFHTINTQTGELTMYGLKPKA